MNDTLKRPEVETEDIPVYPFDDYFVDLVTGKRKEPHFYPGLTFQLDNESGGIIAFDRYGHIFPESQFEPLIVAMQRFYSSVDAEYISQQHQEQEREAEKLYWQKQSKGVGKPGWIYLIRSEHGHYKIGKSSQGTRRAHNFTIQLPFSVEVIHQFSTPDCDALEKTLHLRYAKKRINGEWFNLDIADVAEIGKMESLDE